ncbi:MAG: hypothetical protein A2152_00755 [Candidatus Levybacteria bacterium RBG_16_35_6]|nr:MAG: hypothetical protein A2152_00755 [Candidatus Levybacteria bacterium RBG_16_35_6]
MKERQPDQQKGLLERLGYLSRNVEITVGAIAFFFGHLGFAALMGIGAVIDHTGVKILEKRRINKEKIPQAA